METNKYPEQSSFPQFVLHSARRLLAVSEGMYWPTCLLCCLVLRRTICRMLELVMSETTSDTRFHTRSRAPHNMWYWRRRMPCRHSWPSSIFLHFPFLEGSKVQVRYFMHMMNTNLMVNFKTGCLFMTKSWVICKSLGMAFDLKTTLAEC